ncbi:DUF397 domain-containing protein [Streptomyces sp. NPDC004749]
MTTTDKGARVNSEPDWRTSSYTGTENCVEVADGDPTDVLVRDTKDRGGPVLHLSPGTWAEFVPLRSSAPRPRLFFAPTREEAAWAVERMDSDGHQLALLLALKSYQRMGRFPKPEE